jgi:hypothetical protein
VLYSKSGVSWSLLPKSPNSSAGIVGDGTTGYVSVGFPYGYPGTDPYQPYYNTSEDAPGPLVAMKSPMMRDGWYAACGSSIDGLATSRDRRVCWRATFEETDVVD